MSWHFSEMNDALNTGNHPSSSPDYQSAVSHIQECGDVFHLSRRSGIFHRRRVHLPQMRVYPQCSGYVTLYSSNYIKEKEFVRFWQHCIYGRFLQIYLKRTALKKFILILLFLKHMSLFPGRAPPPRSLTLNKILNGIKSKEMPFNGKKKIEK
jgi:hypothetical protein